MKARGIFLNRDGKTSCEWVRLPLNCLIDIIVNTYLCFLASQGFKIFLRNIWEPFQEQFELIEMRFNNNANIVFRLVVVHSANVEHENNAHEKRIRKREEGRSIAKPSMAITYINME